MDSTASDGPVPGATEPLLSDSIPGMTPSPPDVSRTQPASLAKGTTNASAKANEDLLAAKKEANFNTTMRQSKFASTDEELAALRAKKEGLMQELAKAEEKLSGGPEDTGEVPGWPAWRVKLRQIMTLPSSSRLAGIVSFWSNLSVIICIVLMIIVSNPAYRTPGSAEAKAIAYWIGFGLQVSFLTEMLLNWLVMKNMAEFFSFFSIIDMLTIIPYWIATFVTVANGGDLTASEMNGLSLLRVLRLLRLMKVFKTKKNAKIFLLWQALNESTFGIVALLIVFPLLTIFYGTFVYYVETANCIVDPATGQWIYTTPNNGTISSFQSIDLSLWFMTVTLTTTGYGDMTPQTPQGRFVTCLAMLTALFCIAMPMTIVTNSYGHVLDRFNTQSDIVRNLKLRIREIEWKICKLEGRTYVDPFKPPKVKLGFIGRIRKAMRIWIYGDPASKTMLPQVVVEGVNDLVDPDAAQEEVSEDSDEDGVNQAVRELKEFVENREKRVVESEERLRRIEENVGKLMAMMEKLGATPANA